MDHVYLIGNGHLDPVWLWRWQEGFAEIKATFRSALDRIKEFDDFIFTSACSAYYMWIEKSDPVMFEEIRQRVKEGRWCITGGWLIQPDCNIPSGESFARHALISQRYFQEKFGIMAETGYNVDSFGHNGSLPMILQQSRMKNYIFMRPSPEEKPLPWHLFDWESRDGSRVRTYRIPIHYNLYKYKKIELFDEIADLCNSEGTDQMSFYGVGNHGGGPTVSLLNLMHESLDDRFIYSDPNAFFAAQKGKELPVLRADDLQYHAKGCYSAMSEIKANNRRSENALLSAERSSVLSHHLLGTDYPHARFERAWKELLFNQFHDILGGCSIPEAYDDARDVHGAVLAAAADIENFALQQISWNIDTIGDRKTGSCIPEALAEEIGYPVVVFNPNAYDVKGTVCIRTMRNHRYRSVSDNDGNPIALQTVRDTKTNRTRKYARLFEAEVPAMGYRVYRIYDREPEVEVASPFEVSERSIANERLRASFGEDGELCSLYDLKEGRELLSAPSRLVLCNDKKNDTWAHGERFFKEEKPQKITAKISVTENGPVRATLRVVQTFGKSTLTRDYSLLPTSNRLEVKVKVDFHEKFRVLKLELPVNCEGGRAISKIPFGSIERPTDGSEQVCGDWIALDGGNGSGLGIATDSKHSFDADGNRLSITVLRSALYADHFGGKNRDEFCEFMEQGIQRFAYSIFPFVSCADAERKSHELQNPLWSVMDTFHRGKLPVSFGGMRVSAPNAAVTAIKEQTDGRGLIVRLYETDDKDTDVTLELFGASYSFHLPHSAVKTLLIRDGKMSEVDFLE